jgi:hypothetical protein
MSRILQPPESIAIFPAETRCGHLGEKNLGGAKHPSRAGKMKILQGTNGLLEAVNAGFKFLAMRGPAAPRIHRKEWKVREERTLC